MHQHAILTNNKSRCVRAPIEKYLRNRVKNNEQGDRGVENSMISKSKNNEHDGQHRETHNLDCLTTHIVDSEHRDPVAWYYSWCNTACEYYA